MKKAPAIFIAHGSPMNVIEENSFNQEIQALSKKINQNEIKSIICISAHYQTQGTQIDGNERPKTIYDFTGFPKELYQMEYSAPGNPKLAQEIKNILAPNKSTITYDWGFDHGAWNILWHLFPEAKIPVTMISLDFNLDFKQHYQLGKILSQFREQGIMILGSGNIVHSFKGINFSKDAIENNQAKQFNNYVLENIKKNNFDNLINFDDEIKSAAQFSINSSEHYLPLLYVLGSKMENELPYIFNNKIDMSTMSMTSVAFGLESTIDC